MRDSRATRHPAPPAAANPAPIRGRFRDHGQSRRPTRTGVLGTPCNVHEVALPTVHIRALTADDRAATEAFAARIPLGDRAFFDRALLSQVSIAGWTRATPARRLGAFIDDELVGLVTVDPRTGWMSHVAELRLVVQPDVRGRGIARSLVEGAIPMAAASDITKLTVEVMAITPGPIAMFESFGFEREATLVGHVRDGNGEAQDLILLSRFVRPTDTTSG